MRTAATVGPRDVSMDLSIIIPAYNEADRLPRTLTAVTAYLTAQRRSAEIIVVDDGSTDDTSRLAGQVSAVTVIRHDRNRGKGAAVRTGMLAAAGEWRLLCDADLSTPIADLAGLEAHRSAGDIVIGSRRVAGANVARRQSWWKVVGGQLGNLLIQTFITPGLRDTQCGFKLFHRRTWPLFTLQRLERFGYDFELLFLARKFGFRVAEAPVSWYNDQRSKVRGRDYLTTLVDIGRIRWYDARGYYHLP